MREGKNMGIMTTFKKPTLESPPALSHWERELEAPPGHSPGARIVSTLLLGSVALFVYPQRYQKIQQEQKGEANDTG